VNRVGYGAMQLAGPGVWGPPDAPESARRVLRLALDLGVTFFDTANAYGPRTVNQLIGEALRPFPADLGTEVSELTYLRLPGDTSSAQSDVPLEDSLGVLTELRDQGLIRRRTATTCSTAAASRSSPTARRRASCSSLLPAGLRPARPLRRTDRPRPATRRDPGPGRAGLAAVPFPPIVVIPGTTNPAHLRANIAAAEVASHLTDAEVTRLTALADEATAVLGQRPRPRAPARS
jgi:pyridoxine 4-dehydrogenase